MPKRADGYGVSTIASYTTDATLYDLDTATGYDRTGAVSGTIAISALLDFGPSGAAVKRIRADVGYEDVANCDIYSSDDGTVWTFRNTQILGDRGNVFGLASTTRTFGSPITARYWRLSFSDMDSIGGLACHAAVREYWAEDNSSAVIPEFTGTAAPFVSSPTQADFTSSGGMATLNSGGGAVFTNGGGLTAFTSSGGQAVFT